MKTTGDIRRANLLLLIEEVGSQAELSRITRVAAPVISQYSRGVERAPGERRRVIGDDIARRIESKMGKPTGWMDVDRSIARNHEEAAMLDGIRLLSRGQIETLQKLIEQFAAANTASPIQAPEDSLDRPSSH